MLRRAASVLLCSAWLWSVALAQEAPRPVLVRDLAVEGTRRVQPAVVLGQIESRVGTALEPARVAEDVRRVFALGFFDDVQARVEEFEGGVRLTFVVLERPFVIDIALEGNRQIETALLLDRAALSLGRVYNPAEVQVARERLMAAYEEHGYLEAGIAPELERLPDGEARLHFRITEGPRFTIDRIVIEGARGLSERQVKAAMATRERRWRVLGGLLSRRVLEEDLDRILDRYRDHGYLRARIESHRVAVDRERARLTVTIRVVEGPQFTVGRVEVGGTAALPAEEIRRQIRLAPGEPFSRARLAESLRGIADLYGRIGRACAQVTVTLELIEGAERTVERIVSPPSC